MVNYPYVYNAGTLKRFLDMIPDAGMPSKVTQEYLEAAGFKSKNDRAVVPVLKFIGVLNTDGTPGSDHALLRDKTQGGTVLAAHIRQAYSDLFTLFPDANSKSNEALRNFFATKTTAGGAALGLIVATFKTLCESGDFAASRIITLPEDSQASQPLGSGGNTLLRSAQQSVGTGVTVNLNISLQLPTTENHEIYDKIFKSLKDHLIERKSSADS